MKTCAKQNPWSNTSAARWGAGLALAAMANAPCTLSGNRVLHSVLITRPPSDKGCSQPVLEDIASSQLTVVATYSAGGLAKDRGYPLLHALGTMLLKERPKIGIVRGLAVGKGSRCSTSSSAPFAHWRASGSAHCIEGPNVGAREAHTVWAFCHDFYYHLPRAALFVQDDPALHTIRRDLVDRFCSEMRRQAVDDMPLPTRRVESSDAPPSPPSEEDEDAPAHGIRGWHLAVPSWAELPTKARKSKAALRRAAAARRWQDEEADVLASGCVTRSFEGAVTMVDTVHDAFCVVDGDCYVPASANPKDDDDWAAAPLRVGDVLSVRAAHRPQGRNKWTAYRAERVSRAPPGKARRGREKRVERHVRRPRAVEERGVPVGGIVQHAHRRGRHGKARQAVEATQQHTRSGAVAASLPARAR